MRDGIGVTNEFYSQLPTNQVLIKGQEENGEWIVYIEASNEMKDQDGETLDVSALKKAKDYFLNNGVISWDHQHKITRDPKYIIGEPMDVRFTDDNRTLVKARLYKENEIAQNLWKNIQSGAKKLGASVGGGILQKAKDRIKQVVWNETAITHKPVNSGTMSGVSMVPFSEFAKALTAGSGVDASQFTGGRALTRESLQGTMSDKFQATDNDRTNPALYYALLKEVYKGNLGDFDEIVDAARQLAEYVGIDPVSNRGMIETIAHHVNRWRINGEET